MRSKRSSGSATEAVCVSVSFIGSVIVTRFDNGVHLTLSVARAAIYLDRCEQPFLGEIPYGSFLYAEFGTDLLLGEQTVFLGFQENRKKAIAGGVNRVHHKLVEVGE